MILENDGAPRTIQRHDTYTSTEPFVADMLTFHDSCFLSNANAVYDEEDCRGQMAARTLLRALSHRYVRRERRDGPFLLQLTDLHPSNIFVDEEWNITCLLDLEWVCALPAEMLAVPYWLAGCGIDQIEGERLGEFDKVRQEFMQVFAEVECRMPAKCDLSLAQLMCRTWESKGVWFWYCIESVNAMYSLLTDHIADLSPKAQEMLSEHWCDNSSEMVKRKVADHQRYLEELKRVFSAEGSG